MSAVRTRVIESVNQLLVPMLGLLKPPKGTRQERNKRRENRDLEKRSGSSDVRATAMENGKSGSAKAGTAEEASGRAKDKAKGVCLERDAAGFAVHGVAPTKARAGLQATRLT
jgi:hypothetical protein